MKITRSALKQLIKEEMSRLQEDDAASSDDAATVQVGANVTGIGLKLVAMAGGSGADREAATKETLQGWLSGDGGAYVEGMEELENAGVIDFPVGDESMWTRPGDYRAEIVWPTWAPDHEAYKPGGADSFFHVKLYKSRRTNIVMPSTVPGSTKKPFRYSRGLGGPSAEERADVNPDAANMWQAAIDDQKKAMDDFNKQNGGRGGKVILNGNALRVPRHGEEGVGWKYPNYAESDNPRMVSVLSDGRPESNGWETVEVVINSPKLMDVHGKGQAIDLNHR